MSKRVEIVSSFYGMFEEDVRLEKSRCGQMEFATTMHYIHKFAKEGAKVLEVGAGTGRYSIALAKEGFEVTSVELVESNLEVLRENSKDVENITSYQGDALDLSRFADEQFDVTLVFGPLYHIYEKDEVQKVIEEAIRVTKKGGTLLLAFLSVYAIMQNCYLSGNFAEGLAENFDEEYKTKHFEEQLFTGYDVCDFEALVEKFEVKHLVTVAADGVLELAQGRSDFEIVDEDFEKYLKFHLATCEKRELLGCSSHLLGIYEKL